MYNEKLDLVLVLTLFYDGAYLTFKSIFYKALQFDCKITLEAVAGNYEES